jgi:CrcB protein
MREFLLVGIDGAVGSVVRYWVWTVAAPRSGGFPWATMSVNLTGSFVLGLLAGVLAGRIGDVARFLLFFGVLSGYTTFSTFSVDNVELLRVGEVGPAAMNIAISVVGGLALAYVGILIGEALNAGL